MSLGRTLVDRRHEVVVVGVGQFAGDTTATTFSYTWLGADLNRELDVMEAAVLKAAGD